MKAKGIKYPIYPITFAYVCGIFCGLYFKLPLFAVCTFVAVLFSFLLFLHFRQLKNAFQPKLSASNYIAVFLLFLCLGFLNYTWQNKSVEINDLSQRAYTLRISETLKTNKYTHRAYAELLNVPGNPKVLVSYPNTTSLPSEGAIYKLVGKLQEIPEPRNLFDFNYKNYLEQKHIYYQLRSYNEPLQIGVKHTLASRISHFRNNLMNRFEILGYDVKTTGFVEALLFGGKLNLDNELQQQFKELGILHVLAVSGMHVVVLFASIGYVLKLFRISKKLINISLISFLIIFTFMAGLSGSVVRAAVMCLMAMLGTHLGTRQATSYLLAGSMLLILLVTPNYLFDAGFQLSYLAVFSIVYCYPVLQPFFTTKNKVLNYFTEMIGVSIAAQLGVLPLSIFYFNQIPLLFLLGNIVAIPLTTVLLVAWFGQLVLQFISVAVGEFFTPILTFVARLCFDGVAGIANKFTIKSMEVHFGLLQMLLITLLVFCCFWYFYKKSTTKIIYALGLIVCLQIVSLKDQVQVKKSSELVLVADYNNLAFLYRNGKELWQFAKKDTLPMAAKKYALTYKIKSVRKDSIANVFELNGKKWLLIDSLSVYPKTLSNVDCVVLCGNPKINPERLIQELKPKLIILHSNNAQYLVDEYATYFEERKIPCYNMRSKGAYVLGL